MVLVKGETMIASAEVKDSVTNAYVDPTTINLSVIFAGVTKSTGAMTKDDVGKYHYDYLIADEGRHEIIIEATRGSRISIEQDYFLTEHKEG